MALLQLATTSRVQTAVPSTVHCDHLITAESGADADLARANDANREVYDFLQSAAQKYGLGFWRAGSGTRWKGSSRGTRLTPSHRHYPPEYVTAGERPRGAC